MPINLLLGFDEENNFVGKIPYASGGSRREPEVRNELTKRRAKKELRNFGLKIKRPIKGFYSIPIVVEDIDGAVAAHKQLRAEKHAKRQADIQRRKEKKKLVHQKAVAQLTRGSPS